MAQLESPASARVRMSRISSGAAGSVGELRRMATLINSPTFRRPGNSPTSRAKRNSKELVEFTLKEDASITMEDLIHVRRLGEGAFATVTLYTWVREPPLVNVPVAVKRLKSQIPGPPDPLDPERVVMVDAPLEFHATFRAEAIIVSRMRHPNVVASYGCVQASRERELFTSDDDPLMFAQEFCDCGSLLDKVRRPASYSAVEAIGWVSDVAAGMEYLHGRHDVRVAHRDLKLENIMLSSGPSRPTAKVGDFGLSRLLVGDEFGRVSQALFSTRSEPAEEASPERPSSVRSSDPTGRTGSMRYMAPEMWKQEAYTHKVDVFSFAILAFEVLSRTRAYESHLLTMEQVAKAVCDSGLRPRLPKKWPRKLSQLLEACWAQDAKDRPEFAEISIQLAAMHEDADRIPEGQPNELLDALRYSSIASCCLVQ